MSRAREPSGTTDDANTSRLRIGRPSCLTQSLGRLTTSDQSSYELLSSSSYSQHVMSERDDEGFEIPLKAYAEPSATSAGRSLQIKHGRRYFNTQRIPHFRRAPTAGTKFFYCKCINESERVLPSTLGPLRVIGPFRDSYCIHCFTRGHYDGLTRTFHDERRRHLCTPVT